jgi:tetratricopeptide (TPR) repeat protein
MGGVGKTQLVIEYVYRHLDEYDLVWWIPAEQTASVLTSLTQLAERLGLPTTEDRQQTARTVLDALAGANLAWLLVYDNADAPGTLDQFVPSTGGHVILTTRNHEWARIGRAIEVDVFDRPESIELLQRRSLDDRSGLRISTAEADELADKLGDLPLALEQAAAWYLATAMPVSEYLELLDSHIRDLLSEGKPANYPLTVAALVTVALQQLREAAPATAQLFELFAYLGGEPVAISLLRSGKDADISEPLRGTLAASIPLSRIVRDLSRYGLAKVDAAQRVQVHRLVQRVLRDSLTQEQARLTLRNARNLLAAANPGDPDEQGELDRQREMGPHLDTADMIHAEDANGRQTILDHARYLYVVGDYENSRQLAQRAAVEWAKDTTQTDLGPDGEKTLLAQAQIANATRVLGDSALAAQLVRDAYDRMRRSPAIGPRHEFTLITGTQIGADLRIAGRYREALEFDRESVARHREIFGPGDTYTLRAQANLAVDLRMIGNFTEAFRLDQEIAEHWEDVGGTDPRALSAYINMARSYYGMGAYAAGLEVVERWLPELQDRLIPGHSRVLLGGRTHAILLRKAGRLGEAAEVMRENHERVDKRFGSPHEFAVAATVSYANVLRELGELDEADRFLADALDRYKTYFGPRHPLTLVAEVNAAIVARARGELAQARAIDERCFAELAEVLAPDHPYTLCAGNSLATDHALAGEHEDALALSTRVLQISRGLEIGGYDERNGADHPYVLMRAINLSHDMRATGALEQAAALFDESLAGLRQALGSGHPDVLAVEAGRRTEGDIESPPT